VTEHGELVAGAQILYRKLPGALGTLAYIPKGPLMDWADDEQVATLLPAIDCAVRERGAIALTIEPDLADASAHHRRLNGLGLHPSPLGSVQPRRTIVVDISPEQDAVLKAMKQKTRYNIRLAGRKGVTVREAAKEDLAILHTLMAATAERDQFGVHEPDYYDAAFELFVPRGWARLLLAEAEGEAVAAVMAFAVPPRAWYLYGASSNIHREKMPTYLLQWEAIRWATGKGCTSYDLYGIPDEDEPTLEEQFTQRKEGLWGVYRFKRGFGGQIVRSVGAWDRVYAPLRYELYRQMVTIRNRVLS
jgi:lipid II:glycine glycyltransferase (peptidoglycan interpeptide bridge formation enzyme)